MAKREADPTVEHLTGRARLVRTMLNCEYEKLRNAERYPDRVDARTGTRLEGKKPEYMAEIKRLEAEEKLLGTAGK